MSAKPDPERARHAASLNVATVLLAAGLSRRMGAQNKLLIEIEGEPMVRRLARLYLEAETDVHVVVGYEAHRVCEALEGLPLKILENRSFSKGQGASVRAGLESLTGCYDAALMALSDQPALTFADITALLSAFGRTDRDKVLIPYHKGSRGNPVIFPMAVVHEILAADPGANCRGFIDANPRRTCRYEAPNAHFVADIDTPEDMRAFESGSRGQKS